jgi:hypothetical protein
LSLLAAELPNGESQKNDAVPPTNGSVAVTPTRAEKCRMSAETARLFLEEPTISLNGRYLVYCRSNGGSSLWVLTLGQQPLVRPNRAP